MAKVYTFLVILSAMTVLFTLVGIPTGMGKILSVAGLIPGGDIAPEGSTLWSTLSAIFAITGAVGIIASFFGRSTNESTMMFGLCALLMTFVADAVSLLSYVKGISTSGFAYWICAIIFIPLIVGYAISIVSFWRGGD